MAVNDSSLTKETPSPLPVTVSRGIGTRAATEIALDARGYVLTGADLRFGAVKRVASAVGEGSMAMAFVHQYLRNA